LDFSAALVWAFEKEVVNFYSTIVALPFFLSKELVDGANKRIRYRRIMVGACMQPLSPSLH
jgi:hypothetical protein